MILEENDVGIDGLDFLGANRSGKVNGNLFGKLGGGSLIQLISRGRMGRRFRRGGRDRSLTLTTIFLFYTLLTPLFGFAK